MPKAKKTTKKKTASKKTAKKSSLKKVVGSVVKKITKKKAAPKKATKAKTPPKKKKVAKKAVKKPAAKPAKKKVAKKKATVTPKKSVKTKKNVKKTEKNNDLGMNQTKNESKIESPQAAPVAVTTPQPTITEDKKLDTTLLDEMDVAPFDVEHDDDYMNDQQREYFRKILIRWKQQLMSEVDSTMGHMQEDGLSFPDPIDRAAQEEGFNLELRTRDRERKLIKKIESALDMIEMGEYGYCEDCGADIGVRRLEARPTATKCIDCKTYAEIREKQSGG